MRRKRFAGIAIIATSAWMLISCSSQQQEEEIEATEQGASDAESEETVQTEEVEDIDPSAAEDPIEEDMEELDSGGGVDEIEGAEDAAGGVGLGAGFGDRGTGQTAPAGGGFAAPQAETATGERRIVLYVKANDVPIYSTKNANSGQTGTLNKGDRIVVTEEGDWAKINSTHYVPMKFLSKRGIGRDPQKSQWQGPGSN